MSEYKMFPPYFNLSIVLSNLFSYKPFFTEPQMPEEYNDDNMIKENDVLDIIRRGLSPEALQVNDGNTSPYVNSLLELECLKIILQEATRISLQNLQLRISVQLRLPVVVGTTEHTRLWTIVLTQAKDSYYKTMIHDVLSKGFATVSQALSFSSKIAPNECKLGPVLPRCKL